jgi:DNA-binding MarR family transcriptional regulator
VTHPATRLDDAVHQRTRLGILTILCEAGRVDFSYLRDALELTDGNLSRNLSRLQNAGYVKVEKVIDGRRPRTWLSATPAGRRALDAEIVALREIIESVSKTQRRSGVRPLTEPT